MVLEHLLSPCFWLLSMKRDFCLPFLYGNVEVLKVSGKYECESGHTMSFKLSTTKVLLSGFYLIEMFLPFQLVSPFGVLCCCVL